tara:strand:- start:630 stop:1508 length:879 start_codon:yes stop_codon:yes gene_type:complete
MKGIWQSASKQMQWVYLLILLIVSFVFFYLIGMLGVTLGEMPNMLDLTDGNTMAVLKWMQGCSSIGLFVVPPLLFSYFTNHQLGWKHVNRQQILLAVAFMMLSRPFINGIAIWNEGLHLPSFLGTLENWMRQAEAEAVRMTEAFLIMDTPLDLFINLVIIAIIPAVGEELLFRGVIQKLFLKWNEKVHLSVWLTAFVFSAVHMQFLGFFPRLILGAVLGYMLVWSGSLWLPVAAHFTNNAFAVLLTYFIGMDKINPSVENLGREGGSILLISGLGGLLLLYLLKEMSNKKQA